MEAYVPCWRHRVGHWFTPRSGSCASSCKCSRRAVWSVTRFIGYLVIGVLRSVSRDCHLKAMLNQPPNSISSSCSSFQDGIEEERLLYAPPRLSSLLKAVLETVPVCLVNTVPSRSWRMEGRLLPFYTSPSFRRSVLWCIGLCMLTDVLPLSAPSCCEADMKAQRCCSLLDQPPSDMHFTDGSAWTILCAATLRYKFQIRLAFSPSQSILASSQPVLGADPLLPSNVLRSLKYAIEVTGGAGIVPW